METANLSISQLEQLIELTSGMYSRATEELDKWHQRYLKPRDTADFQKAKGQMSYWQEKQLSVGADLDTYKAELEGRAE